MSEREDEVKIIPAEPGWYVLEFNPPPFPIEGGFVAFDKYVRRVPIVAWQVTITFGDLADAHSWAKPVLINKCCEHKAVSYYRPDKRVGIHTVTDDFTMDYDEWRTQQRDEHNAKIAGEVASAACVKTAGGP